MFDLNLMHAINAWQCGGNHAQKVRRGAALKAAARDLPAQFRSCQEICFRQEAHEQDRLFELLADEALPETIAAWTTDYACAQWFKGGVPPEPLRGIIFKRRPEQSEVILNLNEVYAADEFHAACEQYRGDISGFEKGIGRYGGRQKEVVLEVGQLDTSAIVSFGGFSSSRFELAAVWAGRSPTEADLQNFDALLLRANIQPGAWWLSPQGTSNVLDRIAPKVAALRAKRDGAGSS